MQPKITAVQKSQEVSALLAIPDSRIIAGGTTFRPESEDAFQLVDISGLEGFDGIRQKGSRIELGPLATLSAASSSMLLKAYAPALAEAAETAATAEIRERGTIGGNIAADRIGDTAAALLAHGAKLTIKTDTDFREILIDRFWPAGGGNDLAYDEWITRISIPMPKEPLYGAAFGKLGEWDPDRDPVASAAVCLSLNEAGVITNIRGAVRLGAREIRRMFPLEKALKNAPASEQNFEKAARIMASAVRNLPDEEGFKALLKDILERAAAMAEERRTL